MPKGNNQGEREQCLLKTQSKPASKWQWYQQIVENTQQLVSIYEFIMWHALKAIYGPILILWEHFYIEIVGFAF